MLHVGLHQRGIILLPLSLLLGTLLSHVCCMGDEIRIVRRVLLIASYDLSSCLAHPSLDERLSVIMSTVVSFVHSLGASVERLHRRLVRICQTGDSISDRVMAVKHSERSVIISHLVNVALLHLMR